MSLRGKIALVTGSSRGIGKGIAEALGSAGATVYVTGRRPENQDKLGANLKLTLEATADEITRKGGKGIAVYCDHSDPASIKQLFDTIDAEQHGKLDILVNNAYSAVGYIFSNTGKKFYELEPNEGFELVNNVGLKNHYICSTLAARMMIKQKAGLIVTVSSSGGMGYLFNIPYGIGKAACDRLAADIAVDLVQHNITSVSLWPGPVRTETVQNVILDNSKTTNTTRAIFSGGESTNFSGKCVVALAADANALQETGKILTTADLAVRYSLKDDDGSQPRPITDRFRKYLDTVNAIRDWRDAKLNAKM